jgi:hypothetical protein
MNKETVAYHEAGHAVAVSDELRAKSAAADAVLCETRPGEKPEGSGDGAVMLDLDEAMEAVEVLNRLAQETKTLVANNWPAIAGVATALLERQMLTADEIDAIVRAAPSGTAH